MSPHTCSWLVCRFHWWCASFPLARASQVGSYTVKDGRRREVEEWARMLFVCGRLEVRQGCRAVGGARRNITSCGWAVFRRRYHLSTERNVRHAAKTWFSGAGTLILGAQDRWRCD